LSLAVLRVKCRLGRDVRVLSLPSTTAFSRLHSKVLAKFGEAALA
jgi:hypothetical protein